VMLTDYGTDSIYVGIIKGAMYSAFPEIRIDAITNGIPPYDIVTGAYLLAEAAPVFPKGTVFCCVVDPGVGTKRRSIALATESGHYFVSPDNGLLTLIAERLGVKEIRECTNKALWRSETTSTVFHGRDIYGPVTAALAKGVPFSEVGEKLDKLVAIELPTSVVEGDTARGSVMRGDPYGNLVTTITGRDLEKLGIKKGDTVEVTIGASSYTAPFVNTYAMVPEGQRLIVLQSSGFVECAVNRGNLEQELGEAPRATVILKKAK
ncbi:MAG: SAM-dependent chlorinase/fluorinase, partial [Candidatus Hydrogenedentes bacterium]|nr:SAM-dependent chlorinase/fluorinase [Candidatus Hydrogenedentota bacterium]